MKTVSYIFKWSCVLSGVAGIGVLVIILASWFVIEVMDVILTLVD